jgi:hypothetical protein
MAGRAGRQEGHCLYAAEPAIAEKPRQFERPAEITSSAVAIVGLIEPQHEHTAFGAAFEPVELPQDGRFDLGVAGPRDRQPYLDGAGLHGEGRPGRHEGGYHRDDAHGGDPTARPDQIPDQSPGHGTALDWRNSPAVTHRWPRKRMAEKTTVEF